MVALFLAETFIAESLEQSLGGDVWLALGEVPTKRGPDAVTLYRDPQGGASDIALANLAYRRAKERGRGTEFDFGGQDS